MSELWFYHKKVVIFSVCMVTLTLVLIFTVKYIKPEHLPKYYTVEETINSDIQKATVSDGTYFYDMNYNTQSLTNKRLITIESKEPALDLRTKQNYFELKSQGNSKYDGDVNDALAYISRLEDEGYKTLSVYRCEKYIDTTLSNEDISVRVIVTKTGSIEIFAIDSGKNNINPPYIIEEGTGS